MLTGNGGEFLAVLGLAALVLAVSLFALKVFILTVAASLFVAGPLFISLTPLPVVGHLARGWLLALTGVCLIPIGWCIIFAVAGAISLDVTNLGGGAHIGSRVTGAFAALATFYLTLKWPLMVLGHVRSSLSGLGVSPGASGGTSGAQSSGALAGKAQRSKAKLQAAMLAGGRGIGLAAGTARRAPWRPRRSRGQAGPRAARGRVGDRRDSGGATARAASSDCHRGACRERERQAARDARADARGMAIRRRDAWVSRIAARSPQRARRPRRTKHSRRV